MINHDTIFQHKIINNDKLLAYGFKKENTSYTCEFSIMDHQFNMIVTIDEKETVHFKVIENATNEQYALVHIAHAQGDFVEKVRFACENILIEVATNCFDNEVFTQKQTRRIIEHMINTFQTNPEFLWEKTPDAAVFRKSDNQKWFAIIMNVERSKLKLEGSGKIEIINLKNTPECIHKIVDDTNYLNAYHMNKQHWFTICLDDTHVDSKIYTLIEESFKLAK